MEYQITESGTGRHTGTMQIHLLGKWGGGGGDVLRIMKLILKIMHTRIIANTLPYIYAVCLLMH